MFVKVEGVFVPFSGISLLVPRIIVARLDNQPVFFVVVIVQTLDKSYDIIIIVVIPLHVLRDKQPTSLLTPIIYLLTATCGV